MEYIDGEEQCGVWGRWEQCGVCVENISVE